ncbi:MAG: MFS transporter [bacterium]
MPHRWTRFFATLTESQHYLIYSGLFAAAFGTILPLFAIYFRQAGLTLFQIALLAFVFEGTILLCELPTGVIADLKGRVRTLRLAAALLTLAGLLFIIARDLTWFVVAEIICGIGEAFRSGSAEAWISTRLQEDGRGEEVTQLFAQRMKYNFAAAFVAMLLGGVVAQLYLAAGWVLFVVLTLAGFLFSLMMKENSGVTSAESVHTQSFRKHLRSGLRAIYGSAPLTATLFLLLAGNAAYEGVDQFWQIYASESRQIAALWFGIATALTALILFFSADRLVPRLRQRYGFKLSVTMLALAAAAFLSLFALVGGTVAVLACFVLFSVVRNLQEPLITGFISENSPSQTRATVLSTNNLVSSAGEMIAALGLGWLAGALGLRPVFLIAVLLLFAGWLVFYNLFSRNPRPEPDQDTKLLQT